MAWWDDLELPGATIAGQFGYVTADGPDEDDNPDVILAEGTVTFTATTPAARVDGSWLGIQSVTAQIFEGRIVAAEEDLRPIRLLATDANIGVADWAWRATFDIRGVTLAPLTFKAPRNTTVNLTADLIPIKSQPYQIIEGASIVDAEVSGEGTMRFALSDDSYTKWIDVPNGERGPRGERGPDGDPGADGKAASLAMGSVSAGTTADAWMTGTDTARELNLTLPRGPKGEKGIDGSPGPLAKAVVTETSPGVYEVESAPGPIAVSDVTGLAARLAALEYDSGPRDISGEAPGLTSGSWTIQRVGPWVYTNLYDLSLTATAGAYWQQSGWLPRGFRPSQTPDAPYVNFDCTVRNSNYTPGPLRIDRFGGVVLYGVTGKIVSVTAVWLTSDPIPTTLPGTPA